MNLRKFCNKDQIERLDKIQELVVGFHNINDNIVTYALAGLLIELTGDFVSSDYLKEKLQTICREAK
jgi:hypothetical protein